MLIRTSIILVLSVLLISFAAIGAERTVTKCMYKDGYRGVFYITVTPSTVGFEFLSDVNDNKSISRTMRYIYSDSGVSKNDLILQVGFSVPREECKIDAEGYLISCGMQGGMPQSIIQKLRTYIRLENGEFASIFPAFEYGLVEMEKKISPIGTPEYLMRFGMGNSQAFKVGTDYVDCMR